MSSGTPIPYTKWFKGFSSYSSAAPSRRLQKGEILDSGFDDQSKNPPTNGEAFTLEDEVVIPYDLNQQEQPEAIVADVTVTYTAEDWGAAYLDDALIINLTSDKENPAGQYGGHQTWAKTAKVCLPSGTHPWIFSCQNITMPDANQNKIVCKYEFYAVEKVVGGQQDKEPCPCGNNASLEGGQTPTTTRSSFALSSFSSSSAGTNVQYDMTEDSLVWSCAMGAIRGMGAALNGKIQLRAKELTADLASPASLLYRHPMCARLSIPQGGIVQGSYMEIHNGARIIALQYYLDDTIAPAGVDAAQKVLSRSLAITTAMP